MGIYYSAVVLKVVKVNQPIIRNFQTTQGCEFKAGK